ncbi:MAG TPA: hypothetical protein VGB54_05895 [Allosphingosinicella sp.]|jgi:hypothetical protein
MRLVIPALLAVMTPAAADAQPAAPAVAPVLGERIAGLGWMVGDWRGTGWTILPDGSRSTFDSRETVTVRMHGEGLLVEGVHSATGHPDRIVHDAIGIISWDRRRNAVLMRTALAGGMAGDFPIEIRANGFAWRIEFPGGRIDYLAEYRDGAWVERGRRTGADGRSVDFFEMTLRRQ